MSDIDEISSDLDRTLRTTLMLVGQVIERRARTAAQRARGASDTERRALLEWQAASRRLFLPLTLDQRAAERAAPAVLAGGLKAARDWAAIDPVAAVAADYLQKEWQRLYPERSPESSAAAVAAAPTRLGVDQARELVTEHAPGYYRPDTISDAELVADWSHWSEHGQLPQESVRRHWARHLHREDEVEAAGDAAVAALESASSTPPTEEQLATTRAQAESEALETVWHSSSSIDEDRAHELATRFAPIYYKPSSTDQLREDWRSFIREGELPLSSRQESWATWSGQGDRLEGLVDQDRERELGLIWDEGRSERGALEYATVVVGIETAVDDLSDDNPRVAGTARLAAQSLAEDLPTPTEAVGDREHAAAVFRPLLDPERFNEITAGEAGRAWLAAHVWSTADPEAAAAADQLNRQYELRFGEAPEASAGLVAAGTDELTRDRVVELTGQAHEFYAGRYDGSPAQEYMRGRFGADVDDAAGVSLGYAPRGRELTDHLLEGGATPQELVDAGLARLGREGEPYDLFRERVMIAVRDGDGRVVGFSGRDLTGAEQAPKYLNTPATAAFDKSSVVLGLTEAKSAGARVVRVEGGLDVVAVNLAGQGKVAGASTMGTALSDVQAEALASVATEEVLVTSLDNDEAGHKGLEREITAMAAHGVSVRSLPITESDPAKQWETNPDRLRAAVASHPVVLRPAGAELIGRDLDRASWDHPEDRVRALATASRHVAAAPAQDQETLLRVLTDEYREAYNSHHEQRPLTSQEAAEAAATAVRDGNHRWSPATAWTDTLNDVAADLSTARAEATSLAASAPLEVYDRATASTPDETSAEVSAIRQRAFAGFTRSTLAGVEAAAGKPVRASKPKGRAAAVTAGREDTLSM